MNGLLLIQSNDNKLLSLLLFEYIMKINGLLYQTHDR